MTTLLVTIFPKNLQFFYNVLRIKFIYSDFYVNTHHCIVNSAIVSLANIVRKANDEKLKQIIELKI
jgi:hypothetical protein